MASAALLKQYSIESPRALPGFAHISIKFQISSRRMSTSTTVTMATEDTEDKKALAQKHASEVGARLIMLYSGPPERGHWHCTETYLRALDDVCHLLWQCLHRPRENQGAGEGGSGVDLAPELCLQLTAVTGSSSSTGKKGARGVSEVLTTAASAGANANDDGEVHEKKLALHSCVEDATTCGHRRQQAATLAADLFRLQHDTAIECVASITSDEWSALALFLPLLNEALRESRGERSLQAIRVLHAMYTAA